MRPSGAAEHGSMVPALKDAATRVSALTGGHSTAQFYRGLVLYLRQSTHSIR
jgi:hypothetical protein